MSQIIQDGVPGLLNSNQSVSNTGLTTPVSPSRKSGQSLVVSGTGGDITVNLPPISGANGVGVGYELWACNSGAAGNIVVTADLATADAVNNAPSVSLAGLNTWYRIVAVTAGTWVAG